MGQRVCGGVQVSSVNDWRRSASVRPRHEATPGWPGLAAPRMLVAVALANPSRPTTKLNQFRIRTFTPTRVTTNARTGEIGRDSSACGRSGYAERVVDVRCLLRVAVRAACVRRRKVAVTRAGLRRRGVPPGVAARAQPSAEAARAGRRESSTGDCRQQPVGGRSPWPTGIPRRRRTPTAPFSPTETPVRRDRAAAARSASNTSWNEQVRGDRRMVAARASSGNGRSRARRLTQVYQPHAKRVQFRISADGLRRQKCAAGPVARTKRRTNRGNWLGQASSVFASAVYGMWVDAGLRVVDGPSDRVRTLGCRRTCSERPLRDAAGVSRGDVTRRDGLR